MSEKKTLEEILASTERPKAAVYDSTPWDATEKGKAAAGAYGTAKDAVNGYSPFAFSENAWLEKVKGDIANYGDFSYDINADAIYQQYKDKYIAQGKLASADVMGQAAAMTGGYGNSYAASVGNQAYQAHLQNLNDIIPELYQLALDRHNMGKEDLYNQYGLLMKEYEREYGLYSDEYNKLLDKLGIARDDYYSGADMFHTEQSIKNTAESNAFNDAMAMWGVDTDNAWKKANYDLSERELAMKEEAFELEKQAAALLTAPAPAAPKGSKENRRIQYDQKETQYKQIEGDLNAFIKNGAKKSEINNYLRNALKDGLISNEQYNKLKNLYAPRGNTY